MRFPFTALLVLLPIAALAEPPMPDGAGKETTRRICGSCHGVGVFLNRQDSRDGWNAIVADMIQRGAKGTDDEFGEIVDYLTEHFSKSAPAPKPSTESDKPKE